MLNVQEPSLHFASFYKAVNTKLERLELMRASGSAESSIGYGRFSNICLLNSLHSAVYTSTLPCSPDPPCLIFQGFGSETRSESQSAHA